MKQWQSDPLQGMNVYHMRSMEQPKPLTTTRKSASQRLSRTYKHLLTSIKPTPRVHTNGQLKNKDAAELLSRFKTNK